MKESLRRVIRENRAVNDLVLPGERELACQLQVSRCTLRKALEELEVERVISRSNQMTRILPERKMKGHYAFLAAGNRQRDRFLFSLYQRLWEELSLLKGAAEMDLILTNHFEPSFSSEQIEHLRRYDLIFVSCILSSAFQQLQALGVPLVILDEQHAQADCPLLSLDNRAVGRRAAELLLQAGCRQALAIAYNTGPIYQPFQLRGNAFREAFEAGGGTCTLIRNPDGMENPLTALNFLAEAMKRHLHDGTDALFFLSDECAGFLGWEWQRSHRIPQELKLIAFQGTSSISPRFSDLDSLEMDYAGIASAMLEIVRQFSEDGVAPASEKQYFPPIYRKGGTIDSVDAAFAQGQEEGDGQTS